MSTADEVATYASRILAETREELTRADGKASTLFAVFGIVTAAVLAGLTEGKWLPSDLDPTGESMFWVGCALIATAFCALIFAVWPRTVRHQVGSGATYYGNVRLYANDKPALYAELTASAGNSDRTVEQLQAISGIVWTKYCATQAGIVFFGVGAAVSACGAIVG